MKSDSGQDKNAKQLSTFEKAVILTALIIGLTGGVFLIPFNFPPIVCAIFLSIAIAVLVYHFLGGISSASFNMGPVKMGGSIAALIGCAFVLNHYLENQTKPRAGKLMLTKNYKVLNAERELIGELPLNSFGVELNKTQNIMLGDSIELGKIEEKNFEQLQLFNEVKMNMDRKSYCEILFNLQFTPFSAVLDSTNRLLDTHQYINTYYGLPFSIEPVYKDRCYRTLIKDRNTHKEIGHELMSRDEIIMITDFMESDSKVYFVRIRQLDFQQNNFVQYQVIDVDVKTQRKKNV
ncbi:hypothetical protein EYV94_21150 [Puteibacter caeruleilacunae]|nr:hypothetical protein EYV94_21150 [Puteibacter caeruleilacunae]